MDKRDAFGTLMAVSVVMVIGILVVWPVMEQEIKEHEVTTLKNVFTWKTMLPLIILIVLTAIIGSLPRPCPCFGHRRDFKNKESE